MPADKAMDARAEDARFTVRSFRDGDEDAILELFARSFHLPRTREHFDWKYRRNPFGSEHISVAFDDANREEFETGLMCGVFQVLVFFENKRR